MDKKKDSAILADFIKRDMGVYLFLLFCYGILAGVFFLYSLTGEPVLYALFLCGVSGIVVEVYRFIKYRKKIRILEENRSLILVHLEGLPDPKGFTESNYQELIRILHKENERLQMEVETGQKESIDYYTLWAHQIKTPIAAMRLLIQSQEREFTDELGLELFKIEQYVEMVLQYQRLGSMSNDMNLRLYNLEQLIRQAVKKYSRMFILKNIALNLGDVNCRLITDEKWLVFVLEQILSNALKYTKQGTISIALEKEDSPVLMIEDTGIGIWEEDLPRVFDKGFTGYNGRKDKKSTGIGLYLCAQVLDKLSYTIDIQSQVGKGTAVRITFDSNGRVFE